MLKYLFRVTVSFLAVVVFFVFPVLADEQELAKKSQNPVGDIISLPFEYWHHDGMADDGSADALMVKPVYPTRIGNLNLINRLIIPYLGIDANQNGSDLGEIDIPPTLERESGLGNIQYQGFFTPAEPGKVIWGIGPVFELPTNTSGLGSDKASAGPAAVALTMPGKWVLGALIQNIWSFAGPSGDPDVKQIHLPVFCQLQLGRWLVFDLDPDHYCRLGTIQRQSVDRSLWRCHWTADAFWQAASRFQTAGIRQCGKTRRRTGLEHDVCDEVFVFQKGTVTGKFTLLLMFKRVCTLSYR